MFHNTWTVVARKRIKNEKTSTDKPIEQIKVNPNLPDKIFLQLYKDKYILQTGLMALNSESCAWNDGVGIRTWEKYSCGFVVLFNRGGLPYDRVAGNFYYNSFKLNAQGDKTQNRILELMLN